MTTSLPRPKAILFDWDNTLVDNWGAIHSAINLTLVAMGHAPWTLEETRVRVAKSLRDSFPALFGDRWPEARKIFYESFEAVHLEQLRALPGAAEMLADLSGSGIYLAVVSNKTGRYLRAEAEQLGWTGYFRRLVGATDAPADKPAVEPVEMALAGSGVARGAEVWFVGDGAIDLECAVNAGLTPIFFGQKEGLAGCAHTPAWVCGDCGSFADLVTAVNKPI
ncbi:MAG: HAD family hydrolase [Gemmatimonas sp.]